MTKEEKEQVIKELKSMTWNMDIAAFAAATGHKINDPWVQEKYPRLMQAGAALNPFSPELIVKLIEYYLNN